ncbi:ultraviolet-B receptor [Acrasis kona]|uniref:Ultraviolet-B receptor n=1 Tax=Acrasis kona TaxID=1008807 RepID=A0AAW2YNY5_9EUKA
MNSAKLYAFGSNSDSSLGTGSNEETISTPRLVSFEQKSPVKMICCGSTLFSLLTDQGEVYVWGSVAWGSVSCKESIPQTPTKMDIPGRVVKICIGSSHCLAITDEGLLYSFGGNEMGALGLGDYINKYQFEQVTSLEGRFITDIDAGYTFSIALTSLGDYYTFGENRYGQCCLGHFNNSYEEPHFSFSLSSNKLSNVSLGSHYGLGLTKSHKVLAWGQGYGGQLGKRDTNRNTCRVVDKLKSIKIKSIHAGYCHCLAVSFDNSLYCWGNNIALQLGLKTLTHISPPFQHPLFDGNVLNVYTNCCAYHSFITTTEHKLFGMGSNSSHQITNDSASDFEKTSQSLESIELTEEDFWKKKEVHKIGVSAFSTIALVSEVARIKTQLLLHISCFCDLTIKCLK